MRPLRGDHCQCSPRGGCGEYFNSTAAFDMHRIGRHGVDRRCMTVAEMLAAGMAHNAGGWWVTKPRPESRPAIAGPAIDLDPPQEAA